MRIKLIFSRQEICCGLDCISHRIYFLTFEVITRISIHIETFQANVVIFNTRIRDDQHIISEMAVNHQYSHKTLIAVTALITCDRWRRRRCSDTLIIMDTNRILHRFTIPIHLGIRAFYRPRYFHILQLLRTILYIMRRRRIAATAARLVAPPRARIRREAYCRGYSRAEEGVDV